MRAGLRRRAARCGPAAAALALCLGAMGCGSDGSDAAAPVDSAAGDEEDRDDLPGEAGDAGDDDGGADGAIDARAAVLDAGDAGARDASGPGEGGAAPDLVPGPDLVTCASGPQNPNGICLTDVTQAALGGFIVGGRSRNNELGVGNGAALGDLDGDGDLDAVLARNDDPLSDKPGGPTVLLRNTGPVGGAPHFSVERIPQVPGGVVRAHGVALGDYDRDGDLDVFLSAEGGDLLLQNDGTGHFAEVSLAAGVRGRNDHVGNGAIFVDLNHDGLLDLYALSWNPSRNDRGLGVRNHLYLNLGDGSFADVSQAAGVDNAGATWAAAAFDLSGTGNLDLYVANDRFTIDGMASDPTNLPDAWYRLSSIDGQGVPVFVDAAADLGVVANRSCMGVNVVDVDGDSTPDLYLTDSGKNWLYLNPHPGQPVAQSVDAWGLGVEKDGDGIPLFSWGARFVDLDRDGALEVYIVNGFFGDLLGCESFHQVPWYLRQPAPLTPFAAITDQVGLAIPVPPCPGGMGDTLRTLGRSPVQGDLDGDGDDDFLVTPFSTPYYVMENDTAIQKHSLRMRLRGTVSSPDPIGATLTVTLKSGRRVVLFRAAGGEVESQSDPVLTVGLGDEVGVARADVSWPSGIAQRVDGLPGFGVDKVVVASEPAWLSVEPRVVKPGDPPAKFSYRPVGESGVPLGMAASGRKVVVTRSDGVGVKVVDVGDGSYTADLTHPGMARRSTLLVTVEGVAMRPRPMVNFK